MPTYVYRCQSCDALQEAVQKMTDAPLTECESCGGSLRRIVQPVGIVFKGSGFYVTDYKRAEGNGAGKSASSGEKSEGGESKPAAKTDAPKSDAPKTEKKETATAAAAS